MNNSQLAILNWQFAILGLLLPAGLILIAGGSLSGRRPARSAVAGLGALALATIGYWACGFAFHAGGVGLVSDLPGLEGLVWEWASPLNLDWGVLGLRGFFLLDQAGLPMALALYLAYLPAVAVAVTLPLLALRERLPGWMAALGGLLVAALVYPMAANWFSGGGWLMHIGDTLGLGHGYVDLTGISTAALVGGLAALLGIVFFGRRLPPLPEGELPVLPPVHLPVLAVAGAVLVTVGSLGPAVANPLLLAGDTVSPRLGVNLALAAAGGAILPCLYTWFTTGAADSLLAARGAAAGILAVSAAAGLIPPWAALALGAAAGLLVPLLTFVVRYGLRIDDPTGAVPVGLLGGVLGIVSVGLFADGLTGQGWNGVGQEIYMGVAGQGVTGFFPAPGMAPDWPHQLNAQLLGLAAISALTVGLVGVLFLVLRVLLLLWRSVPEEDDELSTNDELTTSIQLTTNDEPTTSDEPTTNDELATSDEPTTNDELATSDERQPDDDV